MNTGVFPLLEKSFFIENRKLVIRSRKKPGNKPELFLIELQPFKYVSSLFPTSDNDTYTFDTESQVYKLRLETGIVEISRAE